MARKGRSRSPNRARKDPPKATFTSTPATAAPATPEGPLSRAGDSLAITRQDEASQNTRMTTLASATDELLAAAQLKGSPQGLPFESVLVQDAEEQKQIGGESYQFVKSQKNNSSAEAATAMVDHATSEQSEMIIVFVGPKRKRYSVHKHLLRTGSSYLYGLYCSQKVTGTDIDAEIYLEDSPELFEIVVCWFYHGNITTSNATAVMNNWDSRQYITMYKLAFRLDMLELKNVVMDTFRRAMAQLSHIPFLNELSLLPQEDAGLAPVRAYVLKCNAWLLMAYPDHWMASQDKDESLASVPGELLALLIKEICEYRKRPYPCPNEWLGCVFHDHANHQSRCNAWK